MTLDGTTDRHAIPTRPRRDEGQARRGIRDATRIALLSGCPPPFQAAALSLKPR